MKKEGVTAKSDNNPADKNLSKNNSSDKNLSKKNQSEKNPHNKLQIEEKLKLLDDVDKAYIRGYIDRALAEQKRKSQGKTNK